jgi:hypothetical protein
MLETAEESGGEGVFIMRFAGQKIVVHRNMRKRRPQRNAMHAKPADPSSTLPPTSNTTRHRHLLRPGTASGMS